MKDLLKDDIVWLVVALALLLAVVLTLSILQRPVDDRLISGGVLFVLGGIVNLATRKG